jgi:hypothetical protein
MAEKHKSVNPAGDLGAVFGFGRQLHAAKRIAAVFEVSVATAKLWLSGGIPPMRRRQIAIEILAELDRQELLRASIRRRAQGEAYGLGVADRPLAEPANGRN